MHGSTPAMALWITSANAQFPIPTEPGICGGVRDMIDTSESSIPRPRQFSLRGSGCCSAGVSACRTGSALTPTSMRSCLRSRRRCWLADESRRIRREFLRLGLESTTAENWMQGTTRGPARGPAAGGRGGRLAGVQAPIRVGGTGSASCCRHSRRAEPGSQEKRKKAIARRPPTP